MRNKLRNMVGRWSEAGLVVELTLVNGVVITGRVHEIDSDECIIEPIVDGAFDFLTVVAVPHIVTARYTGDAMPDDAGEEDATDLPADPVERL